MKTLFFVVFLFTTLHVRAQDDAADTIKVDTLRLVESFVDSTKIGIKGKNKIEVKRLALYDSSFVVIKFYSKEKSRWRLLQEFQYEKNDVSDCNVQLSDFNNDGSNDMTYQSNIAARGANEIRRLFIYDKIKDRLIFIKNSDEYPNLQYNPTLNCIDAWLVYGGSSTVFLHLQKDLLVEFASVDLDEYRSIYVYDKNGKTKLISKKKIKDGEQFIRYSNFNPLR